MREVLERFDFDNTISKLDEAGLLFQVVERFKKVDLHPDRIDNPTMGTVFEELLRKFNEALNENPGEHFTPRDVVHLMADLMLVGDEDRIRRRGVVSTVYDPCCGSGGRVVPGTRAWGPLGRPCYLLRHRAHETRTELLLSTAPAVWSSIGRSSEKSPRGRALHGIGGRRCLNAAPRQQSSDRVRAAALTSDFRACGLSSRHADHAGDTTHTAPRGTIARL
jgi:N-6 DNA Methylase